MARESCPFSRHLHQLLELHADELLFALCDRFFQQRGPPRVGGSGQFRHPQQHFLQVLIAIGDLLLFQQQAFRSAELRSERPAALGGLWSRRLAALFAAALGGSACASDTAEEEGMMTTGKMTVSQSLLSGGLLIRVPRTERDSERCPGNVARQLSVAPGHSARHRGSRSTGVSPLLLRGRGHSIMALFRTMAIPSTDREVSACEVAWCAR